MIDLTQSEAAAWIDAEMAKITAGADVNERIDAIQNRMNLLTLTNVKGLMPRGIAAMEEFLRRACALPI